MTNVSTQRWFFAIAFLFLIIQTVFTVLWRSPSVEIPLHDTYFVVSNSQILMSVSAFFAFIGVMYFVFGRMKVRLHTGLNRVHILGSILSILVLILGLVTSGFFTVSKSTNVNDVLFDYKSLNKAIALSGFLLLFAQIVFVLNCINGLFRFRKY